MSRESKPWFWQKRKGWYCTIKGERIHLGSNREEAHREFHRRMAAQLVVQPAPVGDQQLVVVLIDKFLTYVETNLAPDTYEWYRSRLQCWCDRYPDRTVAMLKKHHVRSWIDEIEGKSGAKRNYARSIQRCLSWCDEEDVIERSPIANSRNQRGVRESEFSAPPNIARSLNMVGLMSFAIW